MVAGFVEDRGPFEQLVIVDVEDARGHLGALEHAAGLHEMPAFVARQRGVADAVKPVAAALDRVAETVTRPSSSSRSLT